MKCLPVRNKRHNFEVRGNVDAALDRLYETLAS